MILRDLLAVSVFAVRREPHDFAFVAVFVVSDEFANHGVEAAQRMRQKNSIENFDLIALTARHHGGNEIAGTVVTEAGGLVPGRTVVGAGDVRDVMFEVMLMEPHGLAERHQRLCQAAVGYRAWLLCAGAA